MIPTQRTTAASRIPATPRKTGSVDRLSSATRVSFGDLLSLLGQAAASVLFVCLVWGNPTPIAGQERVRIATFNTSLNRNKAGELIDDLTKTSSQAAAIAEIIQRVRPHVLLLNEFDFDSKGKAITAFQKKYLEQPQNGGQPIRYRWRFLESVNTGVPSGLDLDKDGQTGGPGDAFGFGRHPGQYGMVVLSMFPIDKEHSRTFQNFLWKDMPGALLPESRDGKSFYTENDLLSFRLSSKSHWDVVLDIAGRKLHFLVAHPTPPVFDGTEDRNGRRNHDEIRFWRDYISPKRAGYIYDDAGRKGGLKQNANFVIAGDLNADPLDGDSTGNPIRMLLDHPAVNSARTPSSNGAKLAGRVGPANQKQRGEHRFDTASFDRRSVGNLRLDYVLPGKSLQLKSAGVFWPPAEDLAAKSISATDHRLVWIDVVIP